MPKFVLTTDGQGLPIALEKCEQGATVNVFVLRIKVPGGELLPVAVFIDEAEALKQATEAAEQMGSVHDVSNLDSATIFARSNRPHMQKLYPDIVLERFTVGDNWMIPAAVKGFLKWDAFVNSDKSTGKNRNK